MPISFAVYQMRTAHDHDMIASLYTDIKDPDAFCSGYIECVNAKHVLLAALTPWGYRDGWLLWRVSDIQQVFTGDEYEARLEILSKLRGESREKLLPDFQPRVSSVSSTDRNGAQADILREVLNHANQSQQTITIMTETEAFTGKVRAIDDLRVTIATFDFFGVADTAPTLVPLREIEQTMIGTEEEKMFDLLARHAPENAPHKE